MKKKKILEALQGAERFISGFENCDNEEEQKTVDEHLKNIRDAITDMENPCQPVSIMDVDKRQFPESILKKLKNAEMYEYIDKDEDLNEDLFSCEVRVLAEEQGLEWEYSEEKYLKHLESLMEEQDCSYFRLVIN